MTLDWLTGGIIAGLIGAGVIVALAFYRRTLYAAPWILLVGPADAGKTTLVAGALETASPRAGGAGRADERDIAWHYFKDGVIIDVAGRVAFPPGGTDLTGWHRLLRLFRRFRPGRPLDGVILAIPAPLLLGAQWQSRAQDLGEAIRERLVLAQSHLGFALPIYVVITQSDHLRGSTAFERALPEALLQNMLGWSNVHAASEEYTGEWIAEGFASLHRSIVHAQIELFASSARLDGVSDLFLFSGEVGRLATPLRALLEEVFRPSLYHESFFFRGFFLCGETAPRGTVVSLDGETAPSFHSSPARAVGFIGDLLDQKVFPERGLASPLPGVSVTRLRGRLAGQVISALLAVGLTVGTAWSYVRFRGAQANYTRMLTLGGDLLEQRRQPQRDEQALTEERLAQSRGFLEQLSKVSENRWTAIFMPASIVRPIEPAVSKAVTRVFGDVVLGDFRATLERRASTWLVDAEPEPGDWAPLPADPKDSSQYKALERFAEDYKKFVENYRRYDQLAHGEAADDLSAPSELLAYLTETPLRTTALVPSVARAIKAARSTRVACQVFEVGPSRESLVGRQATALVDDFDGRFFGGENPVLAAAYDFEDAWTTVSDGNGDTKALVALMEKTTALSQAVAAWAALGVRAKASRIPVFELPPFRQRPATIPDFCLALRPDLSKQVEEVETDKDQLTERLLTESAVPFGLLLEQGDKGLALTMDLAALKSDLDDLNKQQAFWEPGPPEQGSVLPASPTWSPEAIDEVVKAFDAYDRYRGQAFGSLTVEDRRALLSIVRSDVAQVLATRLERTATEGAPPSTDRAARLEEMTRLGDQLAKIQRLVPLLASQPSGREILVELDGQASRALQSIDRREALPLYFYAREGDLPHILSAWNDLQSTSSASDARTRWGSVIDEQREGARQLAIRARALVNYIDARGSSFRQPEGAGVGPRWGDLVRRWEGIAADVARYDQKLPDSGLGALDAAMRDVPPNSPEKDCSSRVADGSRPRATGFFMTVRNDLCRALVEDRYSKIATAFRDQLAGNFPFSRDVESLPEATPAQVVSFLKVYDEQGGRSLGRALKTRSCSEGAVTFVRRMDAVYPLLTSVPERAVPAVVLDVKPEFGIARDLDNGGDQIVEWQMDVGRQNVRDSVPAKAMPWATGDVVNVTVRFARDSPSRPVTGVPFARVEDRAVHFEFRGAWALFRLLRSGSALAADLRGLRDDTPAVLGFKIDVEPDPPHSLLLGPGPPSPFTVYMRLHVFQPGKPDPLPVGEFPVVAPRAACSGT